MHLKKIEYLSIVDCMRIYISFELLIHQTLELVNTKKLICYHSPVLGYAHTHGYSAVASLLPDIR